MIPIPPGSTREHGTVINDKERMKCIITHCPLRAQKGTSVLFIVVRVTDHFRTIFLKSNYRNDPWKYNLSVETGADGDQFIG